MRILSGIAFLLVFGGIILLAGGCEAMNITSICTGGVCLLIGGLLSMAVGKN